METYKEMSITYRGGKKLFRVTIRKAIYGTYVSHVEFATDSEAVAFFNSAA